MQLRSVTNLCQHHPTSPGCVSEDHTAYQTIRNSSNRFFLDHTFTLTKFRESLQLIQTASFEHRLSFSRRHQVFTRSSAGLSEIETRSLFQQPNSAFERNRVY